jgi:hypothetical protein
MPTEIVAALRIIERGCLVRSSDQLRVAGSRCPHQEAIGAQEPRSVPVDGPVA